VLAVSHLILLRRPALHTDLVYCVGTYSLPVPTAVATWPKTPDCYCNDQREASIVVNLNSLESLVASRYPRYSESNLGIDRYSVTIIFS